MNFMSFNCRGLASPLKRPALKRVVSYEHPDVFLLQETLGEGEEVKSHLESLFPGWKFVTMDVKGRTRGLSLGWNTQTMKASNCWGMESSLGISMSMLELGEVFQILNIYGPYHNRFMFWDNLLNKSFMKDSLVIFRRRFKFLLGTIRILGSSCKI